MVVALRLRKLFVISLACRMCYSQQENERSGFIKRISYRPQRQESIRLMVERKFEKACLISVQRNLEYALFLVVDNLFFQLRSKDYKALLK